MTRYALGSGQVSVRRQFGAGRTPVLMAVGEGFVGVSLDGPRPVLAKVDPHTMKVVRTIPLAAAGGVAVCAGKVCVTNRTPGTVTRIDARSGQPSGSPIRVGDSPKGIAVLAGSAWVANSGSRTVTRLCAA